ncbi:MAG: thioesterase family protein [Bacteroidetes bacterium]|nr:thioesterase family protein [Bacteroidota bacterium]MBS1931515.1 thioesterase family protein [Bacteroidota bacterium]
MEHFIKEIQVRWSDLDPNFHLRHSVYYDWGAFCRVEFLVAYDLTAEVMEQLNIGPILVREECVFRKEIRLKDTIKMNLQLLRAKRDYSRWSIQHEIVKNNDTIAAVLTVDGAWMSTIKRRLITPPQEVFHVFSNMPLSENFQWLDLPASPEKK